MDEYLARAYYREHQVPVTIARFFNTVGPRQTGAYGMVLPRFVEQSLSARPLTVYGDGNQVRVFLWVGDAVRAAIELMEHPQATGAIVNVGGIEPVTIQDLALRVKTLTGSSSEIVFVPYEEAYGPGFEDIHYRVPDTARLRRFLNFESTKGLDDIILEVVRYRTQNPSHPLLEVRA